MIEPVGAVGAGSRGRPPCETVVFRLGGASFYFDSSLGRGSYPIRGIVPVERTGTVVTGMVRLKGKTVPVLDMAGMLGAARTKGKGARIVVAESDAGLVAFVVDAVVRPSASALVSMPDAKDVTETVADTNLL